MNIVQLQRCRALAGFLVGASLLTGGPVAYANRAPEVIMTRWGVEISCSIYGGQTAINGINIGDSHEKVKRILGAPQRVEYDRVGDMEYTYRGMYIKFINMGHQQYSVCDMNVTGSGYSLIDKVSVGMPEKVLKEKYGEADAIDLETHLFPKLSKSRQQEYAKFRDTADYIYHADERIMMTFHCRKGVIESIKVHETD